MKGYYKGQLIKYKKRRKPRCEWKEKNRKKWLKRVASGKQMKYYEETKIKNIIKLKNPDHIIAAIKKLNEIFE